jgi:hypothetical protein
MADAASALRKLTGGQTLTNEERKLLGMSAVAEPAVKPKAADPANQAVLDKALALKAKLEAQLAAAEKAQADAAAFAAADKAAQTKQAAADRLERIRLERELTQSGANPDNPMPSTPPAPGYKWANYGGVWKQYVLQPGDSGYVAPVLGGGNNNISGGGNNNNAAGGNTTVAEVPAGPTLAINTFKNTLALFFGATEMTKPWVDGLYKSISSFYKTGSTVEESFNLALQASRTDATMKPFTDRFKGIYALQDMKVKGSAIEVPTIAEYFATESKMGDILRGTGLSTLATESFLGDVIGKGVSATEFANRITTVFDRIDQAPKEIKDTLTRFFPTVDRTQLATALLGGDKTAKELEKKIQGYEVLAAAETQGIGANTLTGGITEDIAGNLAAGGATYANTLSGFAQVAQARTTEQKLAEISGTTSMGVTGLTNAVLGKKAKELTALEQLGTQEENRFRGKAGIATLASSRRAQSF